MGKEIIITCKEYDTESGREYQSDVCMTYEHFDAISKNIKGEIVLDHIDKMRTQIENKKLIYKSTPPI